MAAASLAFVGERREFPSLAFYFEARGFAVACLRRPRELVTRDPAWALAVVNVRTVDAELLDICRRSADGRLPPLVVVVGEAGEGVVAALEAGAADVLAMPFSPREALARVRAVLRGRRSAASDRGWRFGPWVLDPARHELQSSDGDGIVLPLGEFALLQGFVEQPQRILSRDELQALAPAAEGRLDPRVMDVRISRLRSRFHSLGREVIETVRGEGYRFTLPVHRLD